MNGWKGGWVDGWKEVKVRVWIAYSNQKWARPIGTIIFEKKIILFLKLKLCFFCGGTLRFNSEGGIDPIPMTAFQHSKFCVS